MGVPEGKVPLPLTWENLRGKQQLLQGRGVLFRELGVEESDDLLYSR